MIDLKTWYAKQSTPLVFVHGVIGVILDLDLVDREQAFDLSDYSTGTLDRLSAADPLGPYLVFLPKLPA